MQACPCARKGFTLVELLVTLALVAILGSLAGAGITAGVRLARFHRNESAACTLYQAAQAALTRLEAEGSLPAFLTRAAALSEPGVYRPDPALTGAQAAAEAELAARYPDRVGVLWLDKADPDAGAGPLLRSLLEPWVSDPALLDASLALELDLRSGRVFAVFYAAQAGRLRFGGGEGTVDITDRTPAHRRRIQVGCYASGELLPLVPPALLQPVAPEEAAL